MQQGQDIKNLDRECLVRDKFPLGTTSIVRCICPAINQTAREIPIDGVASWNARAGLRENRLTAICKSEVHWAYSRVIK